MKTQLLCTFTRQARFNETIDVIVSCNDILYEKIYVLQRKKQSNTLYTINALNEVIRSKNGGVLDKRFNVDWAEYQNTLLLTNETGLNVVPTKIFQIINVTEWNK